MFCDPSLRIHHPPLRVNCNFPTQLIQPFVDKAYCKGWGTLYVTDDLFDEGQPWDNPPTFWTAFIEAAKNIPTPESCGAGGLKVLTPLLGSDDTGEE